MSKANVKMLWFHKRKAWETVKALKNVLFSSKLLAFATGYTGEHNNNPYIVPISHCYYRFAINNCTYVYPFTTWTFLRKSFLWHFLLKSEQVDACVCLYQMRNCQMYAFGHMSKCMHLATCDPYVRTTSYHTNARDCSNSNSKKYLNSSYVYAGAGYPQSIQGPSSQFIVLVYAQGAPGNALCAPTTSDARKKRDLSEGKQ